MLFQEVNFDGLVGPLHNYAGLSPGNLASARHQAKPSSPKQAALQGLDKMAYVRSLGLTQAILPPHRRPAWHALEALGFKGTPEQILQQAATSAPHLLAATCSSSAMWTANAGTFAPSLDTFDGNSAFVTANLASHFHRSIEANATFAHCSSIFNDSSVHKALPATPHFYDEGAANHTRLSPSHSDKGLHLFVYGLDTYSDSSTRPQIFPARQSKAACEAVARLFKLPTEQTIYLQQSTKAIDAGVFHNDVISAGNNNFFLYHQATFEDPTAIEQLKTKYRQLHQQELYCVEVPNSSVQIDDAIASYLFNSQLLTLPSGEMLLLAPKECRDTTSVRKFIEQLINSNTIPLKQVHYMNLRESMCNGGGPACLRLRTVLSEQEIENLPPSIIFTESNEATLRQWINKYYPDRIDPSHLADLALHQQAEKTFDSLERILGFKLINS